MGDETTTAGKGIDTAKHCPGCRDDFYNHNRMGLNETSGTPRCWNADTATLVKARDVPMDMPPPYTRLPLTTRPSCYCGNRVVRVKPEALDAQGFWR